MDPKYHALIEMGFSGAVVLGFCCWQLWSIHREIRRDRARQNTRPAADAVGTCGTAREDDERRRGGTP